MSMTIYSPYDGQPVSVRPQDVGRAIRDSQGLIFYVLATSDQKEHYASRTRHGSAKEEAEYRQRLATMAPSGTSPASSAGSPSATHSAKRSAMVRGLLLSLAILLVLAIAAAAFWFIRH